MVRLRGWHLRTVRTSNAVVVGPHEEVGQVPRAHVVVGVDGMDSVAVLVEVLALVRVD